MSTNLDPRLPTSKKWSNLPREFTDKLRHTFTQQFAAEPRRGEFVAEGRIYPEEVILRVGFLETGRLKQINFEASMDLPLQLSEKAADQFGEENLTMERLYVCIDAIGSLMEEYFQTGDEGEMDILPQWKAFDFEGDEVFLKFSTVNSRLEQEADRILGLDAQALIIEAESNEDALTGAEIDSELAMEVQKMIREGRHPLQTDGLHDIKNDGDAQA